jgi:hypothetical protein
MRVVLTTVRAASAVALLAASWASADATGALSGRVTLAGSVPVRPPLQVFKHEEVCGKGVPDDRLVVGASGGLRYAVVTVEGVRGGRKAERDTTAVLDNRGCRFEPHVQVAEVGQWIELRNSDPILHNADARIGQETVFNVALPPARHVRKPIARAGLVTVTCDVRHTWMKAVVAVTDHPYHTVTDAEGAYEIRDLPPGRYVVRVWHEELGIQERPVTIGANAAETLDVAYPALPPAEEKAR